MPKKVKYSRVTSVLSYLTAQWLQYWWRKVGFEEADRVRDASTDFGKVVHKHLERWLNGEVYSMEGDEHFPFARPIMLWLQENKVQPLEWEKEVKDSTLKLVGHFDLLGEMGGEKYVIDFKTSKKIDKTYGLQLAAYAYLIKKTLKILVNKGIILRVDKETGELEVKEYADLKPYWTVFRAGLVFYNFMSGK